MPLGLTILALAGPPQQGETNPLGSLVLMGLIFVIFWFVLIQPMRRRQRKLEDLVKSLKSGDKIIVNPGIFGVIVGVEEDSFQVRIDDKTRIKVLKSAVAGLQGPPETEKK
ncbi:MAG TPA: preprotein translocase subunit YajC [Vicinamibacteria bacterium]|nr:preprotein translocase subunit YajC [Vicinamibacteria bacterium]